MEEISDKEWNLISDKDWDLYDKITDIARESEEVGLTDKEGFASLVKADKMADKIENEKLRKKAHEKVENASREFHQYIRSGKQWTGDRTLDIIHQIPSIKGSGCVEMKKGYVAKRDKLGRVRFYKKEKIKVPKRVVTIKMESQDKFTPVKKSEACVHKIRKTVGKKAKKSK